MAEHIIEISGQDYLGKSTQAELLTYGTYLHPHNFGGLSDFSDAFPDGADPEGDWAWWFQDTTLPQLGSAVIGAYNNRLTKASESSHDFAIVERGAVMCRAQLAANFATRREVLVEDVVEEVDSFADELLAQSSTSQITEILLMPDDDWRHRSEPLRSFTRSFKTDKGAFSDTQNNFYEQYQGNLARALDHYQAHADHDQAHGVAVDGGAVDVQNAIRSHEALGSLALPKLLDESSLYVGLAGLSESGKSQVAMELAERYGFARFKLGYFNEISRDGTGAYGQPGRIARNIVHFLANNRHMTTATFESFHNPNLAAELKGLLGERWHTVLLRTSEVTRRNRLLHQFPDQDPQDLLAQQAKKDAAKSGQGVERHAEIADVIVDNDGTLDETIDIILRGTGYEAARARAA